MKNQILLAGGLFSVMIAGLVTLKKYIDKSKYKKFPSMHRLHLYGTDNKCLLKRMESFSPDNSDLAFIIVNENCILPINLTQFEHGSFCNRRIYSKSFSRQCKKEVGCTVSYITNLNGYGTLDGIIYCGEYYDTEPSPHFFNKLCIDCISTINFMSKPCDVLLCDKRLGAVFDLYGNYKFSIRNYDIRTHVNWDRTVNISIIDRNLQAVEKVTRAQWKRLYSKSPIILPNNFYYKVPQKQVVN